MPFNGSGTFTVYTPGNPISNGDTSNAVYFNNTMTDFATGLSNTLTKDGQSVPTANIPMGNNKLIGLANGTVSTDAAAYGQLTSVETAAQNGSKQYLTSVSGTNTITASLTGLTAYAAGLTVRFTAAGANTGAVTLNIGSLGAIAVVRADGVALTTGDLLSGGTYEAIYDGTSFKLQGSISASQLTSATAAQIQPISASVASNAMTVTASALALDFRSSTLTSGTVTRVSGTPSSLVVPSGATLGSTSALLGRYVVLALNNSGTIELAIVNQAGGNDLSETGLISTTAISAGSTSASVIYSTTARTNVTYRVIGAIEATEATAGTWATAPSLIQGTGGNAITAMSSVGYGQTWQNVTGSRAVNTVYYNTTGKPITVAISMSVGSNINITVNGVVVFATNSSAVVTPYTFIVPIGANYKWDSASGTLSNWAELR